MKCSALWWVLGLLASAGYATARSLPASKESLRNAFAFERPVRTELRDELDDRTIHARLLRTGDRDAGDADSARRSAHARARGQFLLGEWRRTPLQASSPQGEDGGSRGQVKSTVVGGIVRHCGRTSKRGCPESRLFTAPGSAGGISVNEADQDDWATAVKHSGMDTVHVTVYGKVTHRLLHSTDCQPTLVMRGC